MKANLLSLMVALIAAILQSTALSLPGEVRTFTSTAGTSLQGELVSVNGDMVTIKKADGQSITTKAANFSAADVVFLQAHGLKGGSAASSSSSATGGSATAPVPKEGFTNSLGMKFVPIPDTKVLFCTTLTSVENFAGYADAIHASDDQREKWGGKEMKPTWPAVGLSWKDAKAFCDWLSKKEGRNYRLPTDREWSFAVGIGKLEDEKATPESLSGKIKDIYPWGTQWPPPQGAANLADDSMSQRIARTKTPAVSTIKGYNDHYPLYSPVTAFRPNKYGLHDMAGNNSQWCEDWYNESKTRHSMRGCNIFASDKLGTLSSYRWDPKPEWAFVSCRLVVELPEP